MHPRTAGIDWTLDELIFDPPTDGVAIAMFERHNRSEQALGLRWVQHGATSTTYFGKDSEWILLPFEFAACVARRIIEKKAAGMNGIRAEGFQKMLKLLLDQEAIVPNICY